MSIADLVKQSYETPEDWLYTDLAFLSKTTFTNAANDVDKEMLLPERQVRLRLVFINGFFQEDESDLAVLPPGVTFRDAPEGWVLRVEDENCLAVDPLELLFVQSEATEARESQTKITVQLGEHARLNLIERHINTNAEALAEESLRLNIDLGYQAKLVHGRIVEAGAGAVLFSHTEVSVPAGAFYDHFCLLTGGRLIRQEVDVDLCGEMAETRLHGATLLRGTSHADTLVRVTHQKPNGISRQVFKTVLDDKARGVFQGKTLVAAGAQKTDGHQLCRALLLSDKAEMDAKPELEIYADDVKCSHGSAIGDLDEQALFYLRSRGIPESEARAILVEAFIRDLVDQIQVEALQLAVKAGVESWLFRT